MASGKKLTFTQRAHLPDDLNPKDWLYVKEEIVAESGIISRNTPKTRYMVIRHKTTHERRRIRI